MGLTAESHGGIGSLTLDLARSRDDTEICIFMLVEFWMKTLVEFWMID